MKKNVTKVFTGLVAATFLTSPIAYAHDLKTGLRHAIADDYDANLDALFKHFHANPELSFKETKTAARLDTGLSYASTARQMSIDGLEKPVMHACGHDVHITSLVGTARQLANLKNEWSGTLILIGQPAEERISGAREMLEDGLYKKFPKPDYAVAFHVSAQTPTGRIQLTEDIAYSSSDSVDIEVHGIGAHGASPHKGVDPVLVASQIVVSLQSVVSRTIAPLQAGVITVGSIHGGTKHNIIGDSVKMQLTVRSNEPSVRTALLDGIDRVAKGVALSLGVPEDKLPTVKRSKTESTPPTRNHAETARRLRSAFTEKLGPSVVLSQKILTAPHHTIHLSLKLNPSRRLNSGQKLWSLAR